MRLSFRIILLALSFALAVSCQQESEADTNIPVVFVHGYFGSGDSYEWMAQRFSSNGFPASKIFTFDWNTAAPDADRNTVPLKRFIDKVLKETGAAKVNLAGHSLGGSLVFNFCQDPENAAKVANLALIAPYLNDRSALPAAEVPTLNIYSSTDYVVTDGADIPGASNLVLDNIDHNEAAACTQTFRAIFELFTGKTPTTNDLVSEAKPIVSGRAVSFIENTPSAGAQVLVYAVDPATGYRLSNTPKHQFYADVNGYWGSMPADPNTYYEFRVSTGQPGDRPLHYYHEPFTHSDRVVYLRSYPPKSSLFSAVLSVVPKDNTQASAIFFSVSKALWLGRDELMINGTSLTNTSFLDPDLNTLAIFLYDSNRNSSTDATSIPLFQAFQSIKGGDLYFPAGDGNSITFNYNGRVLNTPAWPSADEGVSVAIFK